MLVGRNVAGNEAKRYDFVMSTLEEIELAARHLTPGEKQKLLILVAQSLRAEGHSLPEPRMFSAAEMEAWMDEDEEDLKKFRGRG
ncbi:MAG TPA: hypothetical protein VIM11_08235 [Tepidisphaeraceae bacterium]|jgi:hypothetical protein